MGVANGAFVPAPGYERGRPIFRIFAGAQREAGPADHEAIARYFRERDKLHLTVTRSDGTLVRTSAIHISDFSDDLGDEAYEIEVHLEDPAFFENP
jgi:hypothetical protein